MSEQSNDDVFRLAKRADDHEWKKIVDCYRLEISRHVLPMLRFNQHDADDVVQDTFLQAFIKRDQCRGQDTFRPWLYQIASSLALKFIRKQKRRRQKRKENLDPDEGGADEAILEEPTPFDVASQKEFDVHLQACRDGLDEVESNCFSYRMEGWNFQEMSAAMKISDDSCWRRVQSALKKIRNCLKDKGYGAQDEA